MPTADPVALLARRLRELDDPIDKVDEKVVQGDMDLLDVSLGLLYCC